MLLETYWNGTVQLGDGPSPVDQEAWHDLVCCLAHPGIIYARLSERGLDGWQTVPVHCRLHHVQA